VGTQYRSAIFYHDDEQRRAAEEVIKELEAEHVFDEPIVTKIEPLVAFYPARNTTANTTEEPHPTVLPGGHRPQSRETPDQYLQKLKV